MQVVPGFPSDLTVASPSARVLVSGVPVEFESVSIRSELESAMPEQVAAGGGAVVAATGDVSILPPASGAGVFSNPWGTRLPSQSATVVVEAGYGEARAKQFTGVFDGGSGSPLDPAVGYNLIDEVDRFDQPITIEPMLNIWPSLTEGDWTYRRAGLSPLYLTNRILRHCGFYATPPMTGGCVLSVPAMGSAWPERGELVSASAISNTAASVARVRSPWGEAWADGKATYNPALGSLSGKLDQTFQMTFMLMNRAGASGNLLFAAYWGTSGFRIAVTGARNISLQKITAGAPTTVITLPGTQITDATTFTARVTPGGSFAIYADNGANVVGTSSLPPAVTTTAMTRVEITVPFENHPAGGFQVGFTDTQSYLYTRTAHLTAPAFYYSLRGFPAVIERNCGELLKEQAEAELAAMWLDENGHFRWVNRNQLVQSDPAGTLTSTANLLDLPWEIASRPMYSKVEVVSREATITYRGRTNITVHQGSSNTMGNGDTDVELIEPGGDEDWYMVGTPSRVPPAAVADVKAGRGSYMGGILISDGVEERWATATELKQTFTRLPGNRFKLETEATPPGTGDLIEQRIFGVEYGSYHNQSLPLLRAKAKALWEDKTVTGAARGPSRAPVLRHEVGAWIQDAEEIQGLADWLAAQVTVTAPIIRDVPIVPDPRIQKGDVFWLEDTHAYDVRLKVLVMGVSLTVNAGPPVSMDQLITCRIITVQRTGATLGEHDAVWAGETLNVHDAFWAGKTLAQQDADPLGHP